MPGNMIVDRECRLPDLLQASDLLIAGPYSITPFEAILLDKPIMVLNPLSQVTSYVFIEQGAAREVCKNKDIVPTIQQVLMDSSLRERLRIGRQKVIQNYASDWPADSTEAIACLCQT